MNGPSVVDSFRNTLVGAVINPIMFGLSAVALLYFAYGMVVFIWGINISGDKNSKENGKRHMLYGILGFVIMTGATAILNLIAGFFGSPPVV